MLGAFSLTNVTHTIWEVDDSGGWSIVEALDGTWTEAKDRADELKTLYPGCTYCARTNKPVNDEGCLKGSSHYGKVLA